ncbi:hypothetical protein OG762_25910 [Streptomyces sp. NBC_01136]|uniref:hypothetical protein n=1 Tax=unclassified Streptomyces TaxID=2593676 RepID=UPI003253CE1E|nr:hypothetical protein OG762_25910 [Streptomyces sp. NBC_01136]
MITPLGASVRPLHSLPSELAEVSLGVDAIPVRRFSRGRRTNGPEVAADPDAGWYDADHVLHGWAVRGRSTGTNDDQ